jgi:hypothetical protein
MIDASMSINIVGDMSIHREAEYLIIDHGYRPNPLT